MTRQGTVPRPADASAHGSGIPPSVPKTAAQMRGEQLLKQKDIKERWQVSLSKAQQRLAHGEAEGIIKPVRMGTQLVRYKPAEIQAYEDYCQRK